MLAWPACPPHSCLLTATGDELLILGYMLVAPGGTSQGSVGVTLPAGMEGKERQKARRDPEELDMHQLIWVGGCVVAGGACGSAFTPSQKE